MDLTVEVNTNGVAQPIIGNGTIAVTPPLDENFWLLRVQVSPKQAVVAFPKFTTVGIGFQHEDKDWNTNLPFLAPAEDIYEHIKINRRRADRKVCIEAIKLLQKAVRDYKLVEVTPEQEAHYLKCHEATKKMLSEM